MTGLISMLYGTNMHGSRGFYKNITSVRMILALIVFSVITFHGLRVTAVFMSAVDLFLVSQDGEEGHASFCVGNDPNFLEPLREQGQNVEARIMGDAFLIPDLAPVSKQLHSDHDAAFKIGILNLQDIGASKIDGLIGLEGRLRPGRYLMVFDGIMTYFTSRLSVLRASDFYLSRISTVFTTGTKIAIAVNDELGKAIVVDVPADGPVPMSFREVGAISINKMAGVIVIAALLSAFIYFVSSPQTIWKIKRVFVGNMIIALPTCIVLAVVYVVVFPGITGFDVVVDSAYTGEWISWFSSLYMLISASVLLVDYGIFPLIHMALFLWSLYNLLMVAQKSSASGITLSKQIAIAAIILLALSSHAMIYVIFGYQRFFTVPCFFIAAWSSLYRAYNEDSPRVAIRHASLAVFFATCTVLMRAEYAVLVPFFMVFIGLIVKRHWPMGTRLMARFLVGLALSGAVFMLSHNLDKTFGGGYSNPTYTAISLRRMAMPYVKAAPLDTIPDGFKDMPNTKESVAAMLSWLSKKLINNPAPYLNGMVELLTTSMFSPDTWGSPHDKFAEIEAVRETYDRSKISTHSYLADNFFMNNPEYVIVPVQAYHRFMSYLRFNDPWILNGNVIAFLLVFMAYPILFRTDTLLVWFNLGFSLKIMATALLAPAGFAAYFYDSVVWSLFALISFLVAHPRGPHRAIKFKAGD